MEQSFEHKGLEADIERLKFEISERLKSPEAKKNEISHRDIVREAARPLVYPSPSTQNQSSKSGVLPDYAADFPTETKIKVEEWIDLAIHKGIAKAADEARKSGSPAALDAFHDALTTKLLDEFQKLGILKK